MLSALLLMLHPAAGYADPVLKYDAENYNPATGVWSDTSGNGNHATAPGAVNRPDLIADATPTDEPALEFDLDKKDYLELADPLDDAAFTGSPAFMIFVVAKSMLDTYGVFLSGDFGGSIEFGTATTAQHVNRPYLGVTGQYSIATMPQGKGPGWNVFAVTYDGLTCSLYANGNHEVTVNKSRDITKPIYVIGRYQGAGKRPFIGQMAALRVYDRVLDPLELDAVFADLQDIYLGQEPPEGEVIGTANMGTNTRLSASVYDSTGQVVRRLHELDIKSGTVELVWDGKDDNGNIVPSGSYEWRAITTNATGADDGNIGDSGLPPHGDFEHPGTVLGVAFDADGNLYACSAWEETWHALRRINAADLGTGLTSWRVNLQSAGGSGGTAVTVGDDYVYVALQSKILRFEAATGASAPWPGLTNGEITVFEFEPDDQVIPGVAVDDVRLWVSNPQSNEVRVYDKGTGAPLGQFSLNASRGIAADGNGKAWIAHDGDKVAKFDSSGSIEPGSTIGSLANPYGVALYAISGLTGILYITEIDTGQVLKYGLTPAPTQMEAWFGLAQPGEVSDEAFYWKYDTLIFGGKRAAIAVSPLGAPNDTQFAVTDTANGRVMFYDPSSGPSVITRLEGYNFPHPSIEPGVGRDIVSTGWMQYEVEHDESDPVYGKPWRLSHNWTPLDGNFGENYKSWSRRIRLEGIDYLYYFTYNPQSHNNVITIYQLNTEDEGTGMRRCALLSYVSAQGAPPDNLVATTDTNGNGEVGDAGDSVTTGDGRHTHTNLGGWWIDREGTIWIGGRFTKDNLNWGLGRLPLRAVEQIGQTDLYNPVYDWDDAEIVYEFNPQGGIPMPRLPRYDPANNRVFALRKTNIRPNAAFHSGGTAVEMRDLDTGERSVTEIPATLTGTLQDTISALAVSTDSAGHGYFFTGNTAPGTGQEVKMFTWDALKVAEARPGALSVSGGWFDNRLPLDAFADSEDVHYVYAEDNNFGRLIRYRFSGVASTERVNGAFSWTGGPEPPDPPEDDEPVADNLKYNWAEGKSGGGWVSTSPGTGSGFDWTPVGSEVELIDVAGSQVNFAKAYQFPGGSTGEGDDPDKTIPGPRAIYLGMTHDASVSFEIWFKPASLSGGTQPIFELNGRGGHSLILDGNKLRYSKADYYNILSHTLSAADIGDYIQMVAVFDVEEDLLSFYINPVATITHPYIPKDTNDQDVLPVVYGYNFSAMGGYKDRVGGITQDIGSSTSPFAGEIGLFRIYEAALTPAEVWQNFLATLENSP